MNTNNVNAISVSTLFQTFLVEISDHRQYFN